MEAATAAIEEAFICGDWERVLRQSREELLARVAANEPRDGTMTQPEEALVSMYLQSVFELAQHDEVETAVMLMQSLAPLPFDISLQWIKFLIAMDNKSLALELLNESLEQCTSKIADKSAESDWRPHYGQLTELLVFHVLLPSESAKVVRDYITKDTVLDEATKQRILDAAHVKSPNPPSEKTQLADRTNIQTATDNASATTADHRQPPQRHGSAARTHDTHTESDPSGDLVAMGGTALAVAALAIGVYRYRDTLRETVSEIGPAVSKGLADAKYALFES